MMPACTFDPESHRYTINGRVVPSVTQVLGDLLPGWRASEFYLGRGQAVHQCAALVARGVAFEHDPRIAGQVEAVRRFVREVQPDIIDVEQQVYSIPYQYGGTLDLLYRLNRPASHRLCIADYKHSLTPSTIYQCAAYALAAQTRYGEIHEGLGVELHEDGTYRLEPYELTPRIKREWLHLLGAYNIRVRLGFIEKEE